MDIKELLDRINELYRKQVKEGLTEEEQHRDADEGGGWQVPERSGHVEVSCVRGMQTHVRIAIVTRTVGGWQSHGMQPVGFARSLYGLPSKRANARGFSRS